jgi:group II intron reverse transcriptase/maturase
MEKNIKAHTLIKQVYYRLNLENAWDKVKANNGAGGIDGVEISDFEAKKEENFTKIEEELKTDSYQPQAVKRVWIAKGDGKERPLGIPTIRDRVVQQAIKIRMEPWFDPYFEESSYGYRSGRNAHQALGDVAMSIVKGNKWIVEVDIKGYFDTIDRAKLMELVAQRISDNRVLELIVKFLDAGVMEDFEIRKETTGTPQGGILSPLLANIYLDYYDKKMKERGYKVIRYADDWVIPCQSKQEAERAKQITKQIIERELKLELHPEKTKITHVKEGFEFLGFLFKEGRSLYEFPRIKAIKKFKEKIVGITRRTRPIALSKLIQEMNWTIRGWGNYFKFGHVKRLFWRLDCWVRRRLKNFVNKSWAGIANKNMKKYLSALHQLVSLYSLKVARKQTSGN